MTHYKLTTPRHVGEARRAEPNESTISEKLDIDNVKQKVAGHSLPTELATVADRYERVVDIRDRFLWKWFHLVNPSFKLSSVDQLYAPKVQDDKTLLTFYITLIDDLLEARGDRNTFEEAIKIPFAHQSADLKHEDVDTAYLALIHDVWNRLEDTLSAGPYYDERAEVFYYDLRQVLNAIRYSYVVSNHPQMANLTEAYAYGSHNMVMFAYADIDLIHSSEFDQSELSDLRKLLWKAQEMARIGNWVSTWERELTEHDFGSGVVINAIESGLVTPAEIRALQTDSTGRTIQRIKRKIDAAELEDFFLEEWSKRYRFLNGTVDMYSLDVDSFLNGMKTVLEFHLGSRGAK